jgi:hypothetical protein
MNFLILFILTITVNSLLVLISAFQSGRHKVSPVFESFSECMVNILHFKIDHYTPQLKVPVILSSVKFSSKSIRARVYPRRYIFCVCNVILFPSWRSRIFERYRNRNDINVNSKKELQNRFGWISLLLSKTAPVHKVPDNTSEIPIYFEQHFLLLFTTTEKESKRWILEISCDRISQHARSFVFQLILPTHPKGLKQQILRLVPPFISQVTYVCVYCSKSDFSVAIQLLSPLMPSTNAKFGVTKSYLEKAECIITGGGLKIFINFSNPKRSYILPMEYVEYLIDSKAQRIPTLSPFIENKDAYGAALGLHEVMNILLFDRMNYTEDNYFDHIRQYSRRSYKAGRNQKFRRVIIAFQDTRNDKMSFSKAVTIVDSQTFNFITCDGTEIRSSDKFVNLGRYISPYEGVVWLAMTIGAVAVAGTMTVFSSLIQDYEANRRYFSKLAFNFQLILSSILENGTDFYFGKFFAQYTRRMQSMTYAILGGWLLSLALFNNVYKGVLTADELIKPELLSQWRSICGLAKHNFSIVVPIRLDEQYDIEDKFARLPIKAYSTFGMTLHLLKSNAGMKTFDFTKCPLNSLMIQKKSSAMLLQQKEEFFNFISSCNKTAFVDVTSRIDDFLEYFKSRSVLKQRNLVFVKGTEEILNTHAAYVIHGYSKHYAGQVYDRLQYLIQSGVKSLFEKWLNKKGFKNVHSAEKSSKTLQGELEHGQCKPLSLRSVPIFILLGMSYILSSFLFMMELMGFLRRKLKRAINNFTVRPIFIFVKPNDGPNMKYLSSLDAAINKSPPDVRKIHEQFECMQCELSNWIRP